MCVLTVFVYQHEACRHQILFRSSCSINNEYTCNPPEKVYRHSVRNRVCDLCTERLLNGEEAKQKELRRQQKEARKASQASKTDPSTNTDRDPNANENDEDKESDEEGSDQDNEDDEDDEDDFGENSDEPHGAARPCRSSLSEAENREAMAARERAAITARGRSSVSPGQPTGQEERDIADGAAGGQLNITQESRNEEENEESEQPPPRRPSLTDAEFFAALDAEAYEQEKLIAAKVLAEAEKRETRQPVPSFTYEYEGNKPEASFESTSEDIDIEPLSEDNGEGSEPDPTTKDKGKGKATDSDEEPPAVTPWVQAASDEDMEFVIQTELSRLESLERAMSKTGESSKQGGQGGSS